MDNIKFLIVNGWSDLNRGDSAIVLGMIQLIRTYSPEGSISVMSEFGEEDPRFKSGYHAIRSLHPDVEILPALFPYPTGGSKVHKILNAVLTLLKSLLVFAFPKVGSYLFRGAKADALRRIMESDVLLSKGGHVFYFTRCSLTTIYSFFKHAFPLLLGARLGKKTALYAQSLGPFRGRICRTIAKTFFDRLDAIAARETISLNFLRSLGVRPNVYLVPDAAFLLRGNSRDSRSITSERFVVLTPRQWASFEEKDGYENYMNSLASAVEWLSALGYRVLLVSHTIGPIASEDDRVAVRTLYGVIKSKNAVEIIDTEGLTAYDLIDLYSSAHLLIGTRFHSVIFALLSGVPVLAISYFGPKTFGIMEDLGLGQYVCDINTISPDKLKAKIQYALN